MSVASVMSQISHVSDETASISSMSLDTAEVQPTNQLEDVLVVSLGCELECPGMMSEQKVSLLYMQMSVFVCLLLYDSNKTT